MNFKIFTAILLILCSFSISFAETESQIFAKAEDLRIAGKFLESRIEYEKLINLKLFSNREKVYLGLGEIYMKYREIDKLHELTKKAVIEFPNSEYAHAGLAASWALKAQRSTNYRYKLDQATNALISADKSIRLNRDCALGLFVKAMIYFNYPRIMGKLEEAGSYYSAVITSLDPKRFSLLHDAYYYLIITERRLRDTESALQILKKALFLFPYSEELRILKKTLTRKIYK